ncbi:chondroitin AC/alginate lyase [Aspergillus cavernicola]|uniref:Chondroitin AC/alginate lyase n=1 Tax=Aspergillus cavernicola TaxID=176166 RepID=A0ABR4I123_9EURO
MKALNSSFVRKLERIFAGFEAVKEKAKEFEPFDRVNEVMNLIGEHLDANAVVANEDMEPVGGIFEAMEELEKHVADMGETGILLNAAALAAAITHPGLLHTEEDFTRIRSFISTETEPQLTGRTKLATHADASYTPSATETICRGTGHGETDNGDAAAAILDAWSGTLVTVSGSSDRFLASGLYGYQMANAAEMLRGYDGWDGVDKVVEMLEGVFLPMKWIFSRIIMGLGLIIIGLMFVPYPSIILLLLLDVELIVYVYVQWDLCNIASLHAIGVLGDNQTAIDQAITYFKEGEGMGALNNAIWTLHEEEHSGKPLGQGQEAGRDQGHSVLDFSLLGVVAQQAYNQGEDLFALNENLILAGAEYVFKYNTNNSVPFTTYTNSHGTATEISSSGRGGIRPVAELLYAHYHGIKGLNASWIGAYRDLVVEAGDGAEGGGGVVGIMALPVGGMISLGLELRCFGWSE